MTKMKNIFLFFILPFGLPTIHCSINCELELDENFEIYRAISHLRSNSCNEDVTKGISCFHDPEYEIQPDLASDLYESKYYWESKDCRAFTSVENPDKVHFICDNPKWTKVDGSQVVSCLISQQWQIPIKMEYFKFPDEIFYLRINGTNIRHLKKGSFKGKKIEKLELLDNPIETLDTEAFQDLDGTVSLTISRSKLIVQNDRDNFFFHPFRFLKSLTYLNLEDNNITLSGVDDSKKGDESYLPNLTYLNLRNNPLNVIERFLFYPLRNSSLIRLNLQSSKVRSIERDAFEHLTNLHALDLYDNQELFSYKTCKFPLLLSLAHLNTKSMISLGFAGNRLPIVPKILLLGFNSNLEELNLSGNMILLLGNTWYNGFPKMTNLKKLIIQDSFVSVISYEAFDNLPSLKHLDLRGNILPQIDGALTKLSKLEYLDISYQCLDVIICAPFVLGESPFQNMEMLKTLMISGMNVFPLTNDTLKNLVNLERLDFDHTLVEKIPNRFFWHTKNLKKLDLSFNARLKALSSQVFDGLSRLEDLNLAYSSGAFEFTYEGTSDLGIISSLGGLKYLNLSCSLGKNCVASYNYTPPLEPKLLSYLGSLTVLDLSNNGLTSWNDDIFVENKNLTHLYLQKNQLVFIKSGLLASFNRLELLDLSENPITCDLYVAKFYEMATRKNISLKIVNWKGGTGYLCHLEDALERTLSFKEYYDSHTWEHTNQNVWYFWISGFVLGSILMVVVALILTVNIYRNRFFIQYSLLIRRNILGKRRNPALDYTFDLFVSYSEDTHTWVTEKMLPTLESNEPVLRCCVHERDFSVGVTVTENIVNCLDQSKKFVLVLTRGFVDNQWCRFEVHLALNRMISSGERNLIVILHKDQLNVNELDKNLKFLLSSWTYLEWSDKGQNKDFWDKLRANIMKRDTTSFMKLPKQNNVLMKGIATKPEPPTKKAMKIQSFDY